MILKWINGILDRIQERQYRENYEKGFGHTMVMYYIYGTPIQDLISFAEDIDDSGFYRGAIEAVEQIRSHIRSNIGRVSTD